MSFRFIIFAFVLFNFLKMITGIEATAAATSQLPYMPQEQIISTGIHCHHRLGNRLFTSQKNRKFLGVDSFGAKITSGRVVDGKKLIIQGLVFGYYCDLIPELPERHVISVESIREISKLAVFLKTDHSTLFSDARFKYFKLRFTNSYNFELEVPVDEFFRPKQAALLEKGNRLNDLSFTVTFQFPDAKGRLIENWFLVTGTISQKDAQGVATFSKINLTGPSGRSWDY